MILLDVLKRHPGVLAASAVLFLPVCLILSLFASVLILRFGGDNYFELYYRIVPLYDIEAVLTKNNNIIPPSGMGGVYGLIFFSFFIMIFSGVFNVSFIVFTYFKKYNMLYFIYEKSIKEKR